MTYTRPDAPLNRFAIFSLVLGLVGGVLPLLGNILGAIFGHRARRQIKERAERGNLLAVIGLVLNYLGLITYLGLGVLAVLVVLGVGGLSTTTFTGGSSSPVSRPLGGNSSTYSECVTQANGNSAATAKCMRDYPLQLGTPAN